MLNILASSGKNWWRDLDRKMFFFFFNVIWDFGFESPRLDLYYYYYLSYFPSESKKILHT